MSTLYNADLKPLTQGQWTHDYQHATKLFLADNYKLSPKQAFLYYVRLQINSDLPAGFLSTLSNTISGSTVSSQTSLQQLEAGMLAKRVELPKFKIDTKTLNSYNRKNVIQTHISYDPVSITFHDDAADTVTGLWNDYYTYYYRDSDYSTDNSLFSSTATLTNPYSGFKQQTGIYAGRPTSKWGYTTRNGSNIPFFKSIQLFSLHNKRFTEYELINPIITDWRHGEHSNVDGTGLLENTMTITFETVKYKTGYINPLDVEGFATIHYDDVQSPISTSVTNIYNDNGLLGALNSGTKDLARPDGSSGSNLLSTANNIANLIKNLQGTNFQNLAAQTLGSIGISAVSQAINSAFSNSVSVPTTNFGMLPSPTNVISGIAGAAAGGLLQTGQQVSNQWVQGVVTGVFQSQGQAPVYTVQGSGGSYVYVNSAGQPITNQQTVAVLDPTGKQISTTSVFTTANGTYNPNSPTDNLKSTQTITDPQGNVVSQQTYNDGTVVTKDANGNQVGLIPGSSYNPNVLQNPAVPQNTGALISSTGQTFAGGVSYYTNPTTGITTTVGGTSAQIVNSLTGTAGLVGGALAGQSLYQGLTGGFLGQSAIGKTVAAGISGAAGLVTGKLINNTLQPIANGFANSISQGFNSVTGSISNFVGSTFGTGGFNANNPNQNVVSSVYENDGSGTITYQDGSQYFKDASGNFTQVQAPTATNWTSTVFSNSGINPDTAVVSNNQDSAIPNAVNNDTVVAGGGADATTTASDWSGDYSA
jgi:hypothetical protein